MSRRVKVLWIDDDLGRVEDAKNIESSLSSLSVDVLHPEYLEKRLNEYKKFRRKKSPDIFLIDYYLNRKQGKGGETYSHFGLTPAAEIREDYPEYPIYLVTQETTNEGEAKLDGWTQAAEASFDSILTLKDIQTRGADTLYYDARDYQLIRGSARGDLGALFTLLKAPQTVRENLRLVLPDELRGGLSSLANANAEGNAIAFAKWVREVLLKTPGFLYDELHTATYLGTDVNYFSSISPKMKRARYSAVFSRTTKPLWWRSELGDIVFSYQKAQKEATTNPWEVAPLVLDVSQEDKSKCAICNGHFPETVAVNLDDYTDERPVHYRCSEPHPNRRRVLYFDEPRTFRIPD